MEAVSNLTNELGLDKINESFAKGFSDVSGRMNGLVRNAAEGYAKAFGDNWWDRITEKSETGKAIRACKKDLYQRLKARECTNPSVYWARILTTAGRPEKEREAPKPHSIEQRIIDEVSRLARALHREDDLDSKAIKARNLLMQVLELYGVELEEAV